MKVLAAVLLVVAGPGAAADDGGHVVWDGTPTAVRWVDGDTFAVRAGPRKGERARLDGYNTLESYGPVHVWPGMTSQRLFELAKQARVVAQAGRWHCTSLGPRDAYGRALVGCADLALHLVESGLAHAYFVDRDGDAALVAAQARAQAARRGLWAAGVPERLVTSAHAVGESDRGAEAVRTTAYDRVCDPRTGATSKIAHQRRYQTCERVCHGGTCLVYVPFEQRYGRKRPRCLLSPVGK